MARHGAAIARVWRHLILDGVRSVPAEVTRVGEESSALAAKWLSPASRREWIGFTAAEWARMSGFYGGVTMLHLLGWGLFLHYSAHHAALLGLGSAAYLLGLRHAFDADHIAAVDDTVRYLLSKGERPLGVGFFFSLGHSTLVFLLALVSVSAASIVRRHLPALQHMGTLLGAGVSAAFLWGIGILNLLVLVRIVRVWRAGRTLPHSPAQVEKLFAQRGLYSRFLGSWIERLIRRSWQMYPVGMLFGLGFDTASEIALMAMALGASVLGTPAAAILSLPILFAAGMCAMDTTDGILMSKAYRWAFVNPWRKIFYNVTLTGLSVAVALVIGTIEWLQVLISLLHWRCGWCGRVSGLDFTVLGYVIVCLFLTVWLVAVALRKLGRFDQRYGTELIRTRYSARAGGHSIMSVDASPPGDPCASKEGFRPRGRR